MYEVQDFEKAQGFEQSTAEVTGRRARKVLHHLIYLGSLYSPSGAAEGEITRRIAQDNGGCAAF